MFKAIKEMAVRGAILVQGAAMKVQRFIAKYVTGTAMKTVAVACKAVGATGEGGARVIAVTGGLTHMVATGFVLGASEIVASVIFSGVLGFGASILLAPVALACIGFSVIQLKIASDAASCLFVTAMSPGQAFAFSM